MLREIEIRATRSSNNTITLSGEAWTRSYSTQWATLFLDGKIVQRKAEDFEKGKVFNLTFAAKKPMQQSDGTMKQVLFYTFKFDDDEVAEKRMSKEDALQNSHFRGLYKFITSCSHQCSFMVGGVEMNKNVTASTCKFEVLDITKQNEIEKDLWTAKIKALDIVNDLYENDKDTFMDMAYLVELQPHTYHFKDEIFNDMCNVVFNNPKLFLDLYQKDTDKEIVVLLKKGLTKPIDGNTLIKLENGVMYLNGEGIGVTEDEAKFWLKRNSNAVEYLRAKFDIRSEQKQVVVDKVQEQNFDQDTEDLANTIKPLIMAALNSKGAWRKRNYETRKLEFESNPEAWQMALDKLKEEGYELPSDISEAAPLHA